MVKVMSFKLRDNMNLKESAEDKLDTAGRVADIEVIGIDKDTLWVLVRIDAMEHKAFNKVQENNINFKEDISKKTFGGGR